ncbi:MAG: transcription-repair coupling factor [Ignavibacteriae bacterium]|nr:transcription-repair coupling factor [Ignavibacteriota bacterium]
MIEHVKEILSEQLLAQQLLVRIGDLQPGESLAFSGLAGSLRSIVLGSLSEQLRRQILLIVADEETAQKHRDDLNLIIGQQHVRMFGAEKRHGVDHDIAATSVEDVETLRSLMDAQARIVVTHAAAVLQPIPNPTKLKKNVLTLEREKEYGFTKLVQRLTELGFTKTQFVSTLGEYSVRGGILDIFPFVGENPLRIEFFGDTIESIREFDATSQRSIKELATASIVPDLLGVDSQASPTESTSQSTLLDFLLDNAVIVLDEPERLKQIADEKNVAAAISWEELEKVLGMFPRLYFTSLDTSGVSHFDFDSISQPSINSSVKILRTHLAELQSKEYTIYVTCDTEAERERLKDLLAELEPLAEDEERQHHESEHHLDVGLLQFSLDALHEGFILPSRRLALFTEHQIFNRQKRRGKIRRARFKGISQRELHELRKGDYVVHADYGIGRFDGLKKIKVRDIEQEVVKLSYEEKDTLYVNLNYVNKIQKYASKEGHIPKLTRLGSGEWDKLKARAKKRVKDIARDLIKLYAKRKHAQGFAFFKDTLWQRELEASFMYEDTPDQAKATAEVKQDMESPFPMDRLICGDVGFGKTEVAVRAAFKSVMSGKQVAVLVPTTILAQQHFNTFVDRLSKYSTRIDVLSRFKTKKEQGEILERLKSGSTDIVIGTHRLLSKDVHFKDLGLLVIDEEHRFGVAAKEKLRLLRADVDTLTLTATPIPRTLHFSLMGARDLSIIATPPRNRLPIVTDILQYHEENIRETILREIHRGGQVFFVHDRVHNMDEVIGRLQTMLPNVRFRQAHGQMHAHELEDVMLAFLERKFDVLVATKIIESGIDMPTVNTIVINRADRFGMAEVYQLRGRVGRSNVQAYASLLVPPISVLPRETVRRLQAIEEFTELGSGFNLAMRDLEIRGAGNLLGGEQSGFIESMGFEMYTKILEEAVGELKEEEFRDLFEVQAKRETENQAVVEADVDVRIPEEYIENDNERLMIYRRLFAVAREEQLKEIADELADRFGKAPEQVENLFALVRVRLVASRLGFRKVNINESGLMIEFPPESETQFYGAESFQRLMTFVAQQKNKRVALKQNGTLLILACSFGKEKSATAFSQAEAFLTEIASVMDIEKQIVST